MDYTAQDVLNALHSEGMSDSALGGALGVSREHICRLRNGAKQASVRLEDLVFSLYNAQINGQMNTARVVGPRARVAQIPEPEPENFLLGFTKREIIIAGVVVLALVIGAIWLWKRAHREDSDFSLSV